MSEQLPYRQPVDSLLHGLEVDPEAGLSSAEARIRLERHGRNQLDEVPPVPGWRRFLAEFQDVLVVLLLIAAAISTGLWLWERDSALPYEALAILAVVLLNATMGFIQESRAEQAVRALRRMTADQAAVLRDGERHSVPSSELVPGDVVLIEEGDTIPADARLVASAALQTAEAALTGESLPVSKEPDALDHDAPLGDRVNMVFSGTTATYGHGKAVVTATGMDTELGHIAGLLQRAPEAATPLQRNLDRVGKMLGGIVVVIAAVLIGTIIVVKDVSTLEGVAEVLILGVALAVAAVPEGLPAVVTLVLSLGVQRMVRRNVIVRRLAAVETLGSASVIASDKTGTLTRNEMTVRVVVTASGRTSFGGSGYAPDGEVTRDDGQAIAGPVRTELERALAAADRANNASIAEEDGRWVVRGDPTEGALLVAARKAGLRPEELDARHPRVAEIPFSSERKLMSTVHRDTEQPQRAIVFTKGAPDVLLPRCSAEVVGADVRPLTDERRREILAVNESLAEEALRTLGVAGHFIPREAAEGRRGDLEQLERELVFAGLIGMIDPPRSEARDAVALARSAGIRPIMITGDHPRTAAVIARELGISDDREAVTGAELDAMTDDQLANAVRDRSVYARVNPGHKIRLVSALQAHGATVAMTGDGVNDAPALKQADIGIAMGMTGTDVSKEAADVVLVDDNFASIVAAVEEGRAIFANIRKFLRYLLSSNIGEVLTMFAGVLLAGSIGLESEGSALVLPLVATQILWINLVTDGPPALALGVDPPDEGLMRLPPRPPDEPIVTARMWDGIVFVGLVMAACTLLVLDASMPGGFIAGDGTLRYGQTMAFTTLMFGQLFNVFNARSEERSAFARLSSNAWLWAAVALSLVLHAAVIYLPPLQSAFGTVALDGGDWARCAGAASAVLWLRELGKLAFRSRRIRRALLVLLVAVGLAQLTRFPALPDLGGRSVSSVITETARTRLGLGTAPMVLAHAGESGVVPLRSGLDAFAARKLLADAADSTLDIQYYIWRADLSGTMLAETMIRAAGRGVRVRLLLDDHVTAGLDPILAALDAHPRIEARLFNPYRHRTFRYLGYLTEFGRLNRRMHNKSFTADNQATIIGGRNVGDEYFDAGDGEGFLFADLDVLAIGPVVGEVSRDFDRYWASESAYPVGLLLPAATPEAVAREASAARARIPEAERAAYSRAVASQRLVTDLLQGTQRFDWSRVTMLSDDPAKALGRAAAESHLWPRLKEAMGTPRQELALISAYFVPGADGTAFLGDLARGGVSVSVLTNSLAATDVAAVHAGYARRRAPLVESGVELWELKADAALPPTGRRRLGGSSSSSLHAKTLAIDRDRVFVGSFNFDPRSARLNTELGFVIPSPAVAAGISDLFDFEVPTRAYRVVADSAGALAWQEQVGGRKVVHTEEPGTGFWLRLGVGFLSLLPIEWLL